MSPRLGSALLVVVLTGAIILVGCAEESEDAQSDQATPAMEASDGDGRLDSGEAAPLGPTPTMSALVARAATTCQGAWRTGDEIEPGHMVRAAYADGTWTVDVVGMWHFDHPGRTTPPGFTGPTREPWMDQYYTVGCTRMISAESGLVREQSSHVVTATPPSQ